MKPLDSKRPRKLQSVQYGLVASLIFARALLAHAESTPPAGLTRTAEQSALLQALDDRLEQITRLVARDASAAHAETVRATINKLKVRRDAFRQAAFDQSKYDELRFDLNVAYQRENLWLAPPLAQTTAAKR